MKLSFVIPAHNEAQYIGKCLDSIFKELKRSPHDTEIIVVDNASDDDTKKIASKYLGVKVVYEPQKGLVRARRAGFLAAQGDLIANVDADTMLTPRWIEHAFGAFEHNEKLVCLSGPFIYYDLPRGMRMLVKAFYGLGFLAYLMNRFILRRASVVQGGNFVVRAAALRSIGGYNTDIDFYGEDADIARRLMKVGEVKFSFGFPIFSSGRRLAKEGVLTTGFRYGINYFWTIFFNRPFTNTAQDIREKAGVGTLAYRPESRAREIAIGTALILFLAAILAGGAYLVYLAISYGVISATTVNRIKAVGQKIENSITPDGYEK